jgi:hypothetical protein
MVSDKLLASVSASCTAACSPPRASGARTGVLAHDDRLDGLGHGADLVDLEQQRVARLLLDGAGHAHLRVEEADEE